MPRFGLHDCLMPAGKTSKTDEEVSRTQTQTYVTMIIVYGMNHRLVWSGLGTRLAQKWIEHLGPARTPSSKYHD